MPTLIAIFFAAMVALATVLHVPNQIAAQEQAIADSASTAILAYRESVINYLNTNSAFVGVVPTTSMLPPWGYTPDGRWANIVANGSLYVYESTPSGAPGLLDTVYNQTQKSHTVGRNASGFLVSAKGLSTGIAVPAAVPNGAILIYGK